MDDLIDPRHTSAGINWQKESSALESCPQFFCMGIRAKLQPRISDFNTQRALVHCPKDAIRDSSPHSILGTLLYRNLIHCSTEEPSPTQGSPIAQPQNHFTTSPTTPTPTKMD